MVSRINGKGNRNNEKKRDGRKLLKHLKFLKKFEYVYSVKNREKEINIYAAFLNEINKVLKFSFIDDFLSIFIL